MPDERKTFGTKRRRYRTQSEEASRKNICWCPIKLESPSEEIIGEISWEGKIVLERVQLQHLNNQSKKARRYNPDGRLGGILP
jgi:hypothetical protein